MGTNYNPRTVTDGLVLCVDPANQKSYDSAENLLSNSEFTNTNQSGNLTITGGQLFEPYGRNTAINFVNTAGSGLAYVYRSETKPFLTGTQYIGSVFSNSATLNLGQGSLSDGQFTTLGSGFVQVSDNWWRHWRTWQAAVDNPLITPQVSLSEGEDVTLCGWQLEKSTSLNPYYRTTAEKPRGTTMVDLSGNNNSGTMVANPSYSSANGGSIVYDGISESYIDCGNASSLDVGNNITVNAWVYIDQTALYQSIVAKVPADFSTGWEIANSTGSLRATLRPTATQINLIGGTLIIGNWYMVTMSFDGTTASLYLNGVQTDSATGGPVTLNSTSTLKIGLRDAGNFITGNTSHVSLYDRALTADEVKQNFNAMRGRYGL